ncbi:MAG: HAMP domain-containing protein [Acidobacteria bacterium]|nr:HAMP domain-containing protein [Acidobacteriota bacterium]
MPVRRDRELTRLYVAAALAVLIYMIFYAYRLLSAQVEAGVDAPSRWGLLALGLANLLAIVALLWIVARSLAKLYIERRRGILGSRIRTRLVVSVFAVALLPSLMLFLVGRNFIAKNIERWFLPETQEVIRDGKTLAEAFRTQAEARLRAGAERAKSDFHGPPGALRSRAGLDLLVRTDGRGAELREGLKAPPFPIPGEGVVDLPEGRWLLARVSPAGHGEWVAGIFLPRELLEGIGRLERRWVESLQVHRHRESLQTIPQSTFLLLTLLTLFAALWTGLTLARTISDPVRALARAAQRVGQGDLQVQLPELGEDELAFLASAFNTMTRDLLASREALEQQSERIERQREYLGRLLEALPVGVMGWQPDGTLRIFNPAARRWFGLEQWELGPGRWEDLEGQPRMGGLHARLRLVRAEGRSLQEELRIGGETDGRLVRAILLPQADGSVLALLEDLSLLAHAEKRAAWQEVARRMAHEVKNPLTPIQLTAQRLLRRSREGRLDPEVVAEGAGTILAEVGSLSRLVDSFSRFAKLPAPSPAPCDAGELLAQVLALYAPTRTDIAWSLRRPEGPLPVRWDGDMVKRALINFVDNALGAVGPGGEIGLALVETPEGIQLAVEDDGSGVPETVRERLFEPYFSTKRKGTGLGLAIARRIAEDHGGRAEYEPLEPGSRFSLHLPRHAGR